MEPMDIDSADSVGDDDTEDAMSIDSINSFNSNGSGFSFLSNRSDADIIEDQEVVFPVTRGPNPRPETLAERRERARAYLREIFPDNHRAARRRNRVVTRKCKLQTILENPYLAGARQPPPGTPDMLNFIRRLAEEYTILRRDAMNLVTLHVLRSVEDPANVTRPVLTDQNFWENAFHLVTTPPGEALARPTPYPELDNTFTNHFNPARVQNNGQAYYAVPAWDPGLRAEVRRNFARKAMTNARNHLLMNIPNFLKRVWLSYINGLVTELNINLRQSPNTLANKIYKQLVDRSDHLPNNIISMFPAAIRNRVNNYYAEHHQAFQTAFADENAQSIIERPSSVQQVNIYQRLPTYLVYLLNQIEENGVRRWTVLPVAKHQVAYMPIDQRSLYHILKIYSIQYPNAHMPPHIMSPNPPRGRRQHRLITIAAFRALSSVQMEQIWEDIFNLNHVIPRRCTYWETDEAGMFPSQHRERYLFNNYIETDGVGVSLTFRRPIATIRGERLPQSSREVVRYPRNQDLTAWRRGMYHLSKNPQGLTQQRAADSRLVYIDPGIRSLVTAVDTLDALETDQQREQHTIKLHNGQYQVQSLFKWSQYRELENRRQYVAEEALRGREATDLHLLYHMMGFVPATVTTTGNFIQYIRMIGEFHTEIYENFNFHYRHREMRMRYFGAHRSALEMLANLLIGVDEQNDPQLPPQLPTFFRHSKKERKNHRRAVRRERRRQPGYVPPLPTIVAYGDGRLRPSMRGYEPTPVETFRAVLARRTLVILTNESYTSIMCSVCHNRTVSLVHQSRGDPDRDMWICTNHRKQKIRRTTGNNRKGRKILWCCDEENNPLTRTSQCPDRVRAAGYRRNVYPYRWCRHCERGIDENGENVLGRVIDRDLNAANNIGRVFTAYINSNGDPNSRPLYLRRPDNQNQHINAQMQEEELVREEIASEEE